MFKFKTLASQRSQYFSLNSDRIIHFETQHVNNAYFLIFIRKILKTHQQSSGKVRSKYWFENVYTLHCKVYRAY